MTWANLNMMNLKSKLNKFKQKETLNWTKCIWTEQKLKAWKTLFIFCLLLKWFTFTVSSSWWIWYFDQEWICNKLHHQGPLQTDSTAGEVKKKWGLDLIINLKVGSQTSTKLSQQVHFSGWIANNFHVHHSNFFFSQVYQLETKE